MSKPLKVFITYSHKNTKAKDQLITCLGLLKREGIINIWHDNEILPGDKWRDAIFSNLADSDLLLYLTSAHSLDSENCNKELAAALKAEIRVIPIILEHCDWQNYQLSDFQALPDRGNPIDEWQPESKGWQSVVGGVRKVVEMQSENWFSETFEKDLRAESEFHRGNVQQLLGQLETAIEAYSQSIDLKPRVASSYNNRGAAYQKKGNFDRAIEDFNTAIELKNNYSQAYYNRGLTYYENGEIEKALENYNKAIKLKPDYAEAYSNRGNIYKKESKFDRAVADYNIAIKLRPDLAEVHYNRSVVYENEGDYDRAIQDCNTAVKLKPDFPEAYSNRGNAYIGKSEFSSAIMDYNTAIKLKPDYAEAYYSRGTTYGIIGNSDGAIKDFDKAIKLKPDFPEAYSNRGNAYFFEGKLENALKDYTEAIQLKHDYVDAYCNRGAVYGITGNYDRAIKDYTEAIKLNPHHANAYNNRGTAWLHLQEWDKAKTDFKTAKQLGVDIIAMFHNSYKDVETYQKNRLVKLPEDLALLLTQRRRDRYPKLQKVLDADGNPLESPDVVNLREQLRNAGPPLSEYIKAKSAFGINTTPTEVFVVNKETRGKLIAAHPASADILKPFLHGQELRRWYVDTPQQWLIFTHRGIAIDDYPAILKYLGNHKESLQKRKGKQAWYELQASPRNAERFEQPKLVCPNVYNHHTFAVDTEGFYYGNTSYLIPTQEKWLCGLLNSRTVEWFYSQVSNQLTIDPLRARSGYIQQIPIPDITPVHKALIAKIVDYLICLQQQPEINSKDLKYARDHVMLGYFERVIDGLIYEAYLPVELHKSDKVFLQPLLGEGLPSIEEIQGDKMSAFRDIFERLYDRMHLVRRHLYYLDVIKPIRVIQGKL